MRYSQLSMTLMFLLPCMFMLGYTLPYALYPGITGGSSTKEIATALITVVFFGWMSLLLTKRFLTQFRAISKTREEEI